MAIATRLFATDEELGKRDDDHKPAKHTLWPFRRKYHVRKRRIAAFVLFCIVAWAFVHNIPTDLKPARERFGNYPQVAPYIPGPATSSLESSEQDILQSGTWRPLEDVDEPEGGSDPLVPVDEEQEEDPTYNHNKPIKFYKLAETLQNIRVDGIRSVLFAASDLKSTSALVSTACEMKRWNKNRIHFAFMGRENISIDDLRDLNSVTEFSCDIFWHDARPNLAPSSTDTRMELSVIGALGHIVNYLHPQAVITYGPKEEDLFFSAGIRKKASELKLALIEIPTIGTESLSWLTRLEGTSLAAWHTASIEILIHAQAGASGSLIRLLKSLLAADYAGFAAPRLTIELPSKLDRETILYLDDLNWPPLGDGPYSGNNQVLLRHRIDSNTLSAEDASTRFIESFYPAHSRNSHVLVLSPQVELSPLFYQFVKYQLLEYQYGSNNQQTTSNLFGISLETPTCYINGSRTFKPQSLFKSDEMRPALSTDTLITPFLWQAPNSNAALYFGDKWSDMHIFLSGHHKAANDPLTKMRLRNRKKLLSSKQPAWSEKFLEYMRLRGYVLMYPSFFSNDSLSSSLRPDAFVTVHTDLYKVPEEDDDTADPASDIHLATSASEKLVSNAPTKYLSNRKFSNDGDSYLQEPSLLRSLHHVLPMPLAQDQKKVQVESHRPHPGNWWDDDDGDEDDISSSSDPFTTMPILDHSGEILTLEDLKQSAQNLAAEFRRNIGGCSEQRKSKKVQMAEDLFCLDDEDDDDGDDDDNEAGDVGDDDPQPRLSWYEDYDGSDEVDSEDLNDEEDEITVSRNSRLFKHGIRHGVEEVGNDADSKSAEPSDASDESSKP